MSISGLGLLAETAKLHLHDMTVPGLKAISMINSNISEHQSRGEKEEKKKFIMSLRGVGLQYMGHTHNSMNSRQSPENVYTHYMFHIHTYSVVTHFSQARGHIRSEK
jgi:hypothetical protein